MHNTNPTLAIRRNRRILRSKVYLLLANNKSEKDFDLLKSSLKKSELEEVMEDACYYVPFPEKLSSIKEQAETIEELLDNSTKCKVTHLKITKKKKIFRKPTELMPYQRTTTLKSQKTIERLPYMRKRETINLKDQIAKAMIRKIDLSRSLLDVQGIKPEERANKSLEVFYKFDKIFTQLEDRYHSDLKQKYFNENIMKKKFRSFTGPGKLLIW